MTALQKRFMRLAAIQGRNAARRENVLLKYAEECDGDRFMRFAQSIADFENEVGARRGNDPARKE